MPKRLDREDLFRRIRIETGASGPLSQTALAERLGVSQKTVSNLLPSMGDIVRMGAGRSTRFAARRSVEGVDLPVTIYRIDEEGRAHDDGLIHPLRDGGCAWQLGGVSGHSPGLPYFVHPARPAGFLGRAIASRHPDLAVPSDPRDWSDDDVLRYLTRYGADIPGDLILGDQALELFLRSSEKPESISRQARIREYEARALDALRSEVGSSAGGEQPKFLARVEGRAVLVKFSPPLKRGDAVAQRTADLLVAEHLALSALNQAGYSAARTLLLEGERVFLQVERFDRIGPRGRGGALSLDALAHEFVDERATTWSELARALGQQQIVDDESVRTIERLHVFGTLIANTDMHPGNLSFLVDGTSILGLAPVYDMLPMRFGPSRGEVVERDFEVALPSARDRDAFDSVFEIATGYWQELTSDERLSRGFRQLARKAGRKLDELERMRSRVVSREVSGVGTC